jgi:protein subunit release factor A
VATSPIRIVVTAKDCRRETFRCGGAGGQNVNKRDTGVRFVHEASGAVGEACDERSQVQNERLAWRRMANSPKFQLWCRMTIGAKEEGYANIEKKVDALMASEHIKVELAPEKCAPGEAFCDKDGQSR